jgi:hypothetical protein
MVWASAWISTADSGGAADELLIDHPVASSIQRLTARMANTIVRWASIESRLWWQIGRLGGGAWYRERLLWHNRWLAVTNSGCYGSSSQAARLKARHCQEGDEPEI